MIKKLTSILLVVMLLTTLTPGTIFAADTSEDIAATFGSYVRGRQDNGDANSVKDGSDLLYVSSASGTDKSNEYFAFVSFDFSGYESKIEAASAIKLKIKAGRYSDSRAGSFNVSVLPDSADAIILDGTSLTYNSLSANKLHTLGTQVMSSTGTLTNGTVVESEDIKSYIAEALKENPENSTVSFRISGADSTVSIFYGYASQKISLVYDSNAVDDAAYIQAKADELEWADISSQSIDSVSEDLVLPSKLYGADVTWTADNASISSDGSITAPKGENKKVTLTAKLNYKGCDATTSFDLTLVAASPKTETLSYSQRAHIRGGSYADSVQGISYGEMYAHRQTHNTTNDRYSFYQFDLSGYEDKIENATKATLTVKGNNATEAFTISLLSDKCDNWSSSDLTFNMADKLGMLANSSDSTDVQTGITLAASTEYTTNNFADALRAAIADNPTNSLVTFRVYGDTQTLVTLKYLSVNLTLEYYEDEINTDALFESKKDSLAWDDVTNQTADSVTENLVLPKKLYGFDLSWASDNAAVDVSTGKVTRSKTGATTVNLTSTVTNGTSTHSKVFTITVPEAVKTGFTLDISDKSATRGGEYGNNIQDLSYAVSYNRIYTRKESLNDGNDRYIYYSFDLSGYEEKIMKAADVTFTMNNQSGGSEFSIALLPKTDYRWEYETLTYNKSNALGMMDAAYTVAAGALCKTEAFTTENFADTLKSVLASNPTSSVVTIRLYADRFSEAIEFNAPSPKLNISYYDMDLDSASFFEEVKDDLAWDDITTQAQNSIIADLKLPSKLYGFDVTWSSDDADINSAGELFIDSEAKDITIGYTVTNGMASYNGAFEFNVSDKRYALDFSNAAGSAAKIYSSTEGAATLVFAAYNDNQLVSVDAVSVEIADGENIVNSLLKTTNASEIKLMLLSDMTSLTPLCSFKLK